MFVDIPSVQIRGYRSATEVNQAMGRVYNYMFLAVAVSMIVSLAVASSPAAMALFFGPITKWITMFAPLVFVFLVPMAINSGIAREGACSGRCSTSAPEWFPCARENQRRGDGSGGSA